MVTMTLSARPPVLKMFLSCTKVRTEFLSAQLHYIFRLVQKKPHVNAKTDLSKCAWLPTEIGADPRRVEIKLVTRSRQDETRREKKVKYVLIR